MNQHNLISRILYTPGEARLRAGWRLITQLALLLSAVFVLSLALIVADLLALPYEISLLINQLVIFISVTSTVLLARRFLDRRSFVSLGLGRRHLLLDLLAGFVIAGVVMGVIFVIMQRAGWLEIEAFAWQQVSGPQAAAQLGLWLLIFILTGWQEELLTRGYWLQNLAEGLSMPWALFISSVLFGLAHLANPNASWVAVLGLVAAGYFLAYGYLRTRQLWLPIGLHIGWNFFEGNVFGFPVSGLDSFRLIQVTVSGPEQWTGGLFGPEAGLIVLPGMLVGAGLIYLYSRIRSEDGGGSPAAEAQPEAGAARETG
jgi:membrane protease YdiL (CAAX protease family)